MEVLQPLDLQWSSFGCCMVVGVIHVILCKRQTLSTLVVFEKHDLGTVLCTELYATVNSIDSIGYMVLGVLWGCPRDWDLKQTLGDTQLP